MRGEEMIGGASSRCQSRGGYAPMGLRVDGLRAEGPHRWGSSPIRQCADWTARSAPIGLLADGAVRRLDWSLMEQCADGAFIAFVAERRWGSAPMGLRADGAVRRWGSAPMGLLRADGTVHQWGNAPMRLSVGGAVHRWNSADGAERRLGSAPMGLRADGAMRRWGSDGVARRWSCAPTDL